MKVKSAKIAVTIDRGLLGRLDQLVRAKKFPNRSRVVQEALRDKLAQIERSRLARECGKLDRKYEKQLAEEGLSSDVSLWPEY